MRYYRIKITRSDGLPLMDALNKPIPEFDSSAFTGEPLQIAFDFPVLTCDVNVMGGTLVIFGLPVTMINQSVNYYTANIEVYAGFTGGLPLEKRDTGLVLSGEITNAFANWQGVNQTLNIVINANPRFVVDGQVRKITFSGKEGERLADVLRRVLHTTFPDLEIDVRVNTDIVLSEDETAVEFINLSDMALSIKSIKDYYDVRFVVQKGRIIVYDNLQSGGVIDIHGWELIGQPTWIEPNKISFKTPLRSDLQVGDTVVLPREITSGPGGVLAVNTNSRNKSLMETSAFTGQFQVTSLRHIGDYYNPSEDGWVTICEAAGYYHEGTS